MTDATDAPGRRHRLIRTSTAGVRAASATCHNLGVAATALHAEPVRVVLDRVALEDLSRRLRATRLAPDAGGTWACGTPGDWLTELVADWQAFDPLSLQARLDQLTHLRSRSMGSPFILCMRPPPRQVLYRCC